MSRYLPDFHDAFMTYSENTEPPYLYRAWVGISMIAAALQRRTWLSWGDNIFPNQFIILIGKSTARKGTAIRLGREILAQVPTMDACWGAGSIEALIEALGDAEKQLPELEPYVPEHLPHSTQCALLLGAEEFASLIAGDEKRFVARLCDIFDAHDVWNYRTIGRGTETFHGVCLNFLSGSVLEMLQMALPTEAIEGGLASRMIMVHAKGKGKVVADPRKTQTEATLFWNLCKDLTSIAQLHGPFEPTDDWVEAYTHFYTEQNREPPLTHHKMDSYLGRRQVHAIKLSMAFSAARGSDMTLTREDFDRAEKLLVATEKQMHHCYTGVGRSDVVRMGPTILERISQLEEAPFVTLFQEFKDDLDIRTFKDLLASLEATKAIEFKRTQRGDGKKTVWVRYTPEAYRKFSRTRKSGEGGGVDRPDLPSTDST